MVKALFKKQILESLSGFVTDKKGKRRTGLAVFGFALLMVFAFGSVGVMFYMTGYALCEPFAAAGLDWLYFSLTGGMALALGLVGSVFMTKNVLYEAKDNDLLLSMPIPARLILFTRMATLYLYTLLFQALVFLPSTICYFVETGFDFKIALAALILLIVMPFGVLAICSILGWLIALVTSKLPWKNFWTLVLFLGFMAVYFVVYSKMNTFLTYVIENGGVVADKVQTYGYPLWKLGLACTGDWLALAVISLLLLAAFALVYLLLSKTYIRLATANRGERKAKYKSKAVKQGSWFGALLKKETLRYVKNPMVLMNAFLGTIAYVVIPFIAIFSSDMQALAQIRGIEEWTVMVIAAVLCFIATMNVVAPISISLEGPNLWLARALPVSTENVLSTKIVFHLLATGIPALLSATALFIVFRIPFWLCVCALLAVAAFIAFTAVFGLTINLKMPNVHWTNEVAVVKQSMSGMIAMFSGMLVTGLLIGGYFLFGKYLFAGGYMLVCAGVLSLAAGILGGWIYTRGVKIFEKLS